jgi:hypothetical protein
MKNELTFNRVLGLKFLYDNFPYFYHKDRIKLYFVNSKNELKKLNFDNENFDTLVLKRSCNKEFISDLKYKDNRFFSTLDELKNGSEEFADIFDFCVECHHFKSGENYYSDRLAIAQFSTNPITDFCDRISFIPSLVKGVNTRENKAYLEIEYPYNTSSIFHVTYADATALNFNNFNQYSISHLSNTIHHMISCIKEYLIDLGIFNTFQLIIRIDSYLNLLPIDFRTPNAWSTLQK